MRPTGRLVTHYWGSSRERQIDGRSRSAVVGSPARRSFADNAAAAVETVIAVSSAIGRYAVKDFKRVYHVNNEGRLYAVDTWTTDGGAQCSARTTDIYEEDLLTDRDEIDRVYADHYWRRADEDARR